MHAQVCLLQDAAEVETVVGIRDRHSILNHIRSNKLGFSILDVGGLGETNPLQSHVKAEQVGKQNKENGNGPVRLVLGNLEQAGEEGTLADNFG